MNGNFSIFQRYIDVFMLDTCNSSRMTALTDSTLCVVYFVWMQKKT